MITITEALAELKLLKSKVQKKQSFILTFLCRQEGLRDPLDKSGGSEKEIASEIQAVNDLLGRYTKLRTAIANANAATAVEINGVKNTIAEWLVWRREVFPLTQSFLTAQVNHIANIRKQVQQQLGQPQPGTDPAFFQLKVNVDEKALSDTLEKLNDTFNTLDGRLSLHNATCAVEV